MCFNSCLSSLEEFGPTYGITGSLETTGHQAADGGAVVCTADTPTNIQKQAWDQMLQKHDGVDSATDDDQEEQRMRPSSSVTSLPPPPSFLLEGDEYVDDDDAASYQDILDGYHSEDNIDDSDLPDEPETCTISQRQISSVVFSKTRNYGAFKGCTISYFVYCWYQRVCIHSSFILILCCCVF